MTDTTAAMAHTPTYTANGNTVRKEPVVTRNEDGSTTFKVGFPVCVTTDYLSEDGAAAVAELMNRGESYDSHSELIAELRAENHALLKGEAETTTYVRDINKENEQYRELIATLCEALEPFAKASDVKLGGEWKDHERFAQTDVGFHLNFGNLREARRALTLARARMGE